MTDRSLIQAAMWASKQPADRIGFQSAGAVPPQFRLRRLFENRITQLSTDEIARKIEQLRPRAESGQDWAYICALEAEAIKRREDDGQFGVGA